MADERGAKVLAADAVACQSAWRCPRVGGAIDPDALDDDHRTALARVRSLTGCGVDDVRACPGHYTRTADAHELVRLHRWLKAGALPLRCPHPSGAVVDALDELASALGAREADDLERMKRKPKEASGG
jgi:hypothetical protein